MDEEIFSLLKKGYSYRGIQNELNLTNNELYNTWYGKRDLNQLVGVGVSGTEQIDYFWDYAYQRITPISISSWFFFFIIFYLIATYIKYIIKHSKENSEKSICFVTGVPGAGKTLVGLQIAIEQFEKKDLAVYLSGNFPLVSVLTEALARDKKKKEEAKTGEKYPISTARRDVHSFIQIVHHYLVHQIRW